MLDDPKLRRALPVEVRLREKIIECYEPKGHMHPSHQLVELRDGGKTAFKLALKISEAEQPLSGSMQLVVNRDFLPETVATLLKMAHLTQFVAFGYRYVYGAAGLMLSEILRTFFIENQNRPRHEKVAAATNYFPPHPRDLRMPSASY